jgi:hypothetical protein
MRVKALQLAGRSRACDAEIERGAAITSLATCRELSPNERLLLCRLPEGRGERVVSSDLVAPPTNTSGRLEPRESGDELWARQVVRGREGFAVDVVRMLLGYRGCAVRAPDDDAPKRPWRAAQLARDDRDVIHSLAHYVHERDARPECPSR